MKLGLAQCDIVWMSPESNRSTAERFFRLAQEQNVDLLAFPEMTFTGFSMDTSIALNASRRNLECVRELAMRYGVAVVYGDVWPAGGKAVNLSIAIDGNGAELWRYAKIHPFSFAHEDAYFQRGTEVVSSVIAGVRTAPFICYDLRFPEVFQVAAHTAELIIVIANWPKTRIAHWDALLKARAIENQAYVAGINRVGEGGGLEYNGHSAVYDPLGVRLNEMSEIEDLIVLTVSEDEAKKVREGFRVKADRDESLYARLLLGGERV